MKKTEELNNQLVARLEEITQRGISKADMARIAGVTPQAVNGWFKKGVISKKSAIAIADAANVSVTWLLGEEVSEDSGLKPNENKMLRLFRQLPEAEQERMIDTFELRLKEIDEYVERYLRSRSKPDDNN
ncbi:helix-turn-helix domain-containing protein [Kluyvera cryocrescens]|uniref:helix-turn-helix domain-containing protein n=1 Tax=Kluyvera TaxID=579 RepID=UPI00224B8985|nr:helix-turn-helix domain-containing protein [Kluyvera cryocrescens]MCX2867727.1 helix-turn-helix domain-containing protein [Kluyvera cryocrescens]HDG1685467.1 helix-turn-helix domain-containing protein [Kluyvera cryocrescens]